MGPSGQLVQQFDLACCVGNFSNSGQQVEKQGKSLPLPPPRDLFDTQEVVIMLVKILGPFWDPVLGCCCKWCPFSGPFSRGSLILGAESRHLAPTCTR